MAVIAAEGVPCFQALQALLGAEAVISLALFHQLLCIGLIKPQPFALGVGAGRAAHVGAFVMLEAHLAEGIIDNVYSAVYEAFLVGILYTQYKLPTLGLCHQVGVQRRAQVAHMHEARRAGREPCPDRCHCTLLLNML